MMSILHFLGDYYTLFFVWLAAVLAVRVISEKRIVINYRLFAGLIIVLALVETFSNALAFNNIKNHFLFNISESVRFFGVGCFFYSNLKIRSLRKITGGFLCIFPLFVLVNDMLFQGFFVLNTASYVFGGSFILLLCVAYLWQLYTSDETQSIFRDPVFWISLAYLFYCAVSVPYIGMLNYLWNDYPTFTTYYYLHIYDTTIAIHNSILTIGFLCMKRFLKQS